VKMRNRLPAFLCALSVALSLAFLLQCSSAGETAQQYQPEVGQEGKDVVWVPTPEALVARMLDLAKVTQADYVIDLGSGDGRIVIAAAKRGARALGIEYNPDMVALSRINAEKAGVSGRASFVQGDIFQADFGQATVLTLYLLPDLNLKLRPKILNLKPGTRVVTNAFSMGDWDPDSSEEVEGRTAYLWIVPAKVAGIWHWRTESGNAELTLRQIYQKLDGSLKLGGKAVPLDAFRLEGDHVSFTAREANPSARVYSGRVKGDLIVGTVRVAGGAGTTWTAQRRPGVPKATAGKRFGPGF
jgi:SAM-dependent methyltransferase